MVSSASNQRARWLTPLCLGLLLIPLLPVVPPGQAGPLTPTVTTLDATLPEPFVYLHAVPFADHAYLLGGRTSTDGPTGQVLRVDPLTANVADTGVALPIAVDNAAVAAQLGYIYAFGGRDGNGVIHDEIVRVDPLSGDVTTLDVRLPVARWGMAAVAVGTDIYLLGGRDASDTYTTAILRFDALSETMHATGRTLARPTAYAAAVQASSAIYLFGGHGGEGVWALRDIQRFDLLSGQTTTLSAKMPVGVYHVTAVADGPLVWLFGGLRTPPGSVDTISRFTPALGTLEVQSVTLPTPRQAMAGLHAGASILLFGGITTEQIYHDDILAFGPLGVPVPVIAPIPAAECSDGGALVELDGSGSYDPHGEPLTFVWSAPGGFIHDAATATTPAWLPFGETTVTLTVSDGTHTASEEVIAKVVDTQPPTDVGFAKPRGRSVYVGGIGITHGAPQTGTVVVGDLMAEVIAQDECGIERVIIQSDHGLVMDLEPPYTYPLKSEGVGTEHMMIIATARDLNGTHRSALAMFDWVHDGPV